MVLASLCGCVCFPSTGEAFDSLLKERLIKFINPVAKWHLKDSFKSFTDFLESDKRLSVEEKCRSAYLCGLHKGLEMEGSTGWVEGYEQNSSREQMCQYFHSFAQKQ